MGIRLIPTLLALVLLGCGFQAAYAVPPFGIYENVSYSPTVTVVESNEDRVRLHLEMEHLPAPGTNINLTQRQPGLWENMNTDNIHLLPRFTIYVALPNTGNPTAVTELWNSDAYPVSPATTLQENTPGQPRVIIGSVGILAGVRVVPVTIKPIKYTNSAAQCSVMTSATVSIEIDDAQGTNPVTTPRTSFSRPWQHVLRAVVTNWTDIPNIHVGSESHILMIVPNNYQEEVADYVTWKEQRGMKVTVVLKSSIGANPTFEQVRTRIINEVAASSPRIDHVVLVGDETQLPVRILYTGDPVTRFSDVSYPGSYTNENYWATIEGTDEFPDVFVGRWVVYTEAGVASIVAHTLAHERDTFAADSLRFEKTTVSSDNTEPSQRITKRHVAQMLAQAGFTQIDSIWGGSAQMANAINNGRTFINYRGSGWGTWWAGIPFFSSDVENLNNFRKLPIVTGIGCGVGMFAGDQAPSQGNGFGETWMTVGSPSQPKGAAGFIGPCWNTHTVYNDCLDSMLYRSFLTYDIRNLMPALAAGKMMSWGVFADFLDETAVLEVSNTMLRQYHVMSDPSLQVFTDTPRRVQVTLPEIVPAGMITITPVVNNMGQLDCDSLQVTAWMGNGNFVTSWIPQGLNATSLAVNTQEADTLIVTFTGDNVLAHRQAVTIGPAGPFMIHVDANVNDVQGNGDQLVNPGETIQWFEVVQNGGNESAQDVTATLSTTAPGITITQGTVTIGAVDTGQTVTATMPFLFTLDSDAAVGPQLQFTVTYQMSNGPNQIGRDTLFVYVPDVALNSLQVIDDNNNLWDRNESVNLRISIRNSGTASLAAAAFSLTCEDPLITIEDGEAAAPAIQEGSDYLFPDDAFSVHSSWAVPAGYEVSLVLGVSVDMGTYTFTDEVTLTTVIGQVGATDPFADNIHQYWLYDNTDVEYSEHPEFEWIEIAPSAGGEGLEIPFSAGDQTYAVQLPFGFSYYGVTYDSLSISTDGWIRPGRTLQTNRFNFPLPLETDNIQAMIAPLWFNLRRPVGETGQICYYYDEATDRFVVEWYQLFDATGGYAETFQVQLLNPATYPTESGEAEWIFLYQELSDRATDPNIGATVGIENVPENAGVTYVHKGVYTTGAAALVAGRAIKLTTEPPAILSATPPRDVVMPKSVELFANYPNPFNPETTIRFALPTADQVRLNVFDVLGRHVATLVDGRVEAGTHRAVWHGRMDSGASATSGVYFYRLEAKGEVLTRKMILLR